MSPVKEAVMVVDVSWAEIALVLGLFATVALTRLYVRLGG
jgi:hypothetical protein